MANLKFLKRVGYSDINTLQDDDSAFFYESGMMIDADGGYHAYHPDNKSGLDYLVMQASRVTGGHSLPIMRSLAETRSSKAVLIPRQAFISLRRLLRIPQSTVKIHVVM